MKARVVIGEGGKARIAFLELKNLKPRRERFTVQSTISF